MNKKKASFFQRYLLPGFIFQSVVIAGGYGTGREIVEFFLNYGPVPGLLSLSLIVTAIWSTVCILTYEFSRVFKSFEYRQFFKKLIGRAWFLFEITYIIHLLLVLAVIGAAAGTLLNETSSLPHEVGVIGIIGAIGFLVFRGSSAIEKALSAWSFVLYLTYGVLFVWSFLLFKNEIISAFSQSNFVSGWAIGGMKYATYSLSVIPAVIFSIRHINTRREAVIAGFLTGPIGVIPAFLFYFAVAGHYPGILSRPVPVNFILETLGSPVFQIVFQIVLFGTLIESGAGMIHAVNERITSTLNEKRIDTSNWIRPVSATILLVIALLLSKFGVIELIAKGYGTLAWFFLFIFVIPIFTVGIWKIIREKNKTNYSRTTLHET